MKISITLKAQPELTALAAELTAFLGTLRTAMTMDPEAMGEAVRAGMIAGASMNVASKAAAHPDAKPLEIAEEDRPDVGAEDEPAAATEPAPASDPDEKEEASDAAPKDGAASDSQKTLADDPAAASQLIQELSHLFLEAKQKGFAEAGSTWLPKFLESMGFKSHLEIPVGHVDFVLMNARQALNLPQEAA